MSRDRWRQSGWARLFGYRMHLKYERCRYPNCSDPAEEFGHLRPAARGGRATQDNLSLVCRHHNEVMGDRHDYTGQLESIAQAYPKALALGLVPPPVTTPSMVRHNRTSRARRARNARLRATMVDNDGRDA